MKQTVQYIGGVRYVNGVYYRHGIRYVNSVHGHSVAHSLPRITRKQIEENLIRVCKMIADIRNHRPAVTQLPDELYLTMEDILDVESYQPIKAQK